MENITDILQEKAQEILTEETLQQIEEAFNKKVEIHVEAALAKQDDEYSTKLEHLLEAIDMDHSKKLDRVIEAIDKNHSDKLIKVVEKYSKALTLEANTFKNDLVGKVSKYLEIYLEKLVPQKAINEAVKNKRSAKMLSEMRKVLAVDVALQKDSIKGAIVDGKKRIDEATAIAESATSKYDALAKENAKLKSRLTLEEKCFDLPEDKAAFCKKVLHNKSAKFISENFDYTLKMFDKNHEEHLEILQEQAKNQSVVTNNRVDRPIVNESVKTETEQSPKGNQFNAYLNELQKY